MPDETEGTPATGEPNTPAPETTPPAPAPETAPAADENALGDAGKKALQAERDARKAAEKAAADALAKVKEFEDATKTKEEKLEADNGSLKSENAELNQRLLRLEVAAEKKVPADLRDFLTGSTREELETKADALLAHLKPGGSGATPAPGSFDGGARENAGGDAPTLDAQIKAAEVKGDTALAMRLKSVKLAKSMVGSS